MEGPANPNPAGQGLIVSSLVLSPYLCFHSFLIPSSTPLISASLPIFPRCVVFTLFHISSMHSCHFFPTVCLPLLMFAVFFSSFFSSCIPVFLHHLYLSFLSFLPRPAPPVCPIFSITSQYSPRYLFLFCFDPHLRDRFTDITRSSFCLFPTSMLSDFTPNPHSRLFFPLSFDATDNFCVISSFISPFLHPCFCFSVFNIHLCFLYVFQLLFPCVMFLLPSIYLPLPSASLFTSISLFLSFVATDDFIHYSSAPRLNTTPPTAPTSFSRGKLTTFESDTSASHSSSNSSTSGTGSSISSSTRGIGLATTNSFLKGARVAPRQRHQQQKRGPGAAMAPDPRGQEDNGSVGSIIAGHRISLNVHYDNEEPQTGGL